VELVEAVNQDPNDKQAVEYDDSGEHCWTLNHERSLSGIRDEFEEPRGFVNGSNVVGGLEDLEAIVDSVSRVTGFVDEHAFGRSTLQKHIENRVISWLVTVYFSVAFLAKCY
jgi:hypothetical protein